MSQGSSERRLLDQECFISQVGRGPFCDFRISPQSTIPNLSSLGASDKKAFPFTTVLKGKFHFLLGSWEGLEVEGCQAGSGGISLVSLFQDHWE